MSSCIYVLILMLVVNSPSAGLLPMTLVFCARHDVGMGVVDHKFDSSFLGAMLW